MEVDLEDKMEGDLEGRLQRGIQRGQDMEWDLFSSSGPGLVQVTAYVYFFRA